MTTKVLIIGAGAIGGFYGSLLAKAGAEVAVVCHSDYDHVKQQGFIIESHTLGTWTFKPSHVLKSAADYQDTADYVLLCTKVIPSVDRVALIRPAVTTNTAIVFIQNGVEIEQEIVDAFPARDFLLLKKMIENNTPGMATSTTKKCQHCSQVIEMGAPINSAEFFYPQS